MWELPDEAKDALSKLPPHLRKHEDKIVLAYELFAAKDDEAPRQIRFLYHDKQQECYGTMIIVLDDMLSLWFIWMNGKWTFDGWECGDYQEKELVPDDLPRPRVSRTRSQRSISELKSMSDDHLSYEVRMFFDAAARIQSDTVQADDALRNGMIESFCIHTRGLLDFLYNVKPYQTDVVASEYFADSAEWETKASVIISNIEEKMQGLRRRIDKRVAHLTWDRLRVSEISQDLPNTGWAEDVAFAKAVVTEGLRGFFAGCDRSKLGDKIRKIAINFADTN